MHAVDQVFSIYAGTRGHLDKVPVEQVRDWETAFLKFIHEQKNDIWQKITDSPQLDDETIDEIDKQIEALEDDKSKLYDKVTSVEGICPLCRNWHYPHCGKT